MIWVRYFILLVFSAVCLPSPPALGQAATQMSPMLLQNADSKLATVEATLSELPTPTQNSPSTPTAPSESEDELFQRIFGRPRNIGAQRVVVPFSINGQEQGQILVLLSPGGTPEVRFKADPVLEKTTDIISSNVQENLQALVDKEGNLSLEALQANGLEGTFDRQQLKLLIQISPAQRKTNVYNLQQNIPPEAKNALKPSQFSGYVNLRGGQSFAWSRPGGGLIERLPLRLDLEGALNVSGWVLEGSAAFTEKGNPGLVRGDLRLVRDAPDEAVRYVVGDLAIPITGYQNSRPMVGITAARNFSLQPYRVTRPISQFQFFLERPSRVEVLVNGRLTQTFQLAPGPQDVRNLPLNAGINEIQLIITDDVGRVQRLDFPAAVASDLLAPGLQQFAYSLGFPSTVEAGGRNYDWNQPTLTVSHRWGLTNTLTMGGYLQADLKQQLVGVEGAWATALGNFGWDVAFSHDSSLGTDYAARLRYDYLKSGETNPTGRTLRLALEYRGEKFSTVGALAPQNDYSYDLSAYYSQKLFWDIGGSFSTSYRFARGDVPDSYRLSMGLSKSFSNGLGVNLNLTQSRSTTGIDEQQAYLSLFWFLPQQRQSIQLTTDLKNTSSPTNRITWNYTSPEFIGGINSSLSLATNPNDYGLTGRLTYKGYRAAIDLYHDLALPLDENQAPKNTTNVSWGTALVFADGYIGWSRPINNSFAIVTRNQNVSSYQVDVGTLSGRSIAQANRLGSAVVPDLQAYQVSSLRVNAPDLPLGYDLGQGVYHLLPNYKSGTLIQVGTDATVFIRGILLDAKDKPISLQAGEVISLTEATWKPVTLFTNKVGRFALEGFKPGRYQINLFEHPEKTLQFNIPSDKTGLYDLGTLNLPD